MRNILKFGMMMFATVLVMNNCKATSNITQFQLDNGLKIVVKEDHRAPVVVSMVWYKVGSAYEPPGITGISHALEHMMFKATPIYHSGEFSKIIAANGGDENAFTNSDYTAYFESLATSRLPISFKLEAARMQHLIFQAAEFDKEIQVVREERRMRTDDSPQGITYERFMATAHVANPYHHPIIGWMSDLMNMHMEDVKAWYQNWYTPNNATLVVVGDVEPKQVLQLATKYFAAIPNRTVPVLKAQHEPPALGEREVTVKVPAKLPMIIMGYAVPSLVTGKQEWEPYALDVLAAILDGGESARLSRSLVREKQIASQVDVDYNIYSKYAGQFSFFGIPTKQHTVAELKQAFSNEIQQLQQHLVSEKELQRVKNQIIAEKTYELDTVFGQAMKIGLLETVGLSWKVGDQYVAKITAVTPQQVQQVAQKYLIEDRLTVAQLQPLPLTSGAPQTSLGAPTHER